MANFETPIFILGLPRSGTSMIAGLLEAFGLWLGETVPGRDLSNPKGFFENAPIRDVFLKQILVELGCDPLGVRGYPALGSLPDIPIFKDKMREALYAQGYDESRPWGFKDPKLTLLWPIWHRAFPDARWIIVSRPRKMVISSCLKTHFLRQHSTSPRFWRQFCKDYDDRLNALRKASHRVWEVDSHRVVQGDLVELESVTGAVGLAFDRQAVLDFVDVTYWGDRNPGSAFETRKGSPD